MSHVIDGYVDRAADRQYDYPALIIPDRYHRIWDMPGDLTFYGIDLPKLDRELHIRPLLARQDACHKFDVRLIPSVPREKYPGRPCFGHDEYDEDNTAGSIFVQDIVLPFRDEQASWDLARRLAEHSTAFYCSLCGIPVTAQEADERGYTDWEIRYAQEGTMYDDPGRVYALWPDPPVEPRHVCVDCAKRTKYVQTLYLPGGGDVASYTTEMLSLTDGLFRVTDELTEQARDLLIPVLREQYDRKGMSRAAGWTVLPILRRGVRFGEDTLELQERRNKSWCDLMDVVRQSGIPIILCSADTDYGIGDQLGWLLSRPGEAELYLQWIARYSDVLEVLR